MHPVTNSDDDKNDSYKEDEYGKQSSFHVFFSTRFVKDIRKSIPV